MLPANATYKHVSTLVNMLLIAAMTAILIATLLQGADGVRDSFAVEAVFVAIGLYAVLEILCDRLPLSLNKMHWYFIFFFMSIAPLTHYLTGYAPGRYPLSDNVIFGGQLVVLLWCVAYSMARRVKGGHRAERREKEPTVISTPRWMAPAVLAISLAALAYMAIRLGGLSSLLIRSEAWFDVEGPLDTVLGYLLRAIPILGCAILFRGKRYSGATYSWLYIIALVPIIILLNYPVSLSRYWIGTVYIGLFVAMIPQNWLGIRRFDLAIILGICIIFPLMYDLKYFDVGTFFETRIASFFGAYEEAFNSVDFDAFTMLCRIMIYAEDYGFSFGRQLVSVVFFFVPRAILPIKGQPTGSMVTTAQGSSYTNLSAPAMGEGYIDFGLIGVVLYAAVFAIAFRSLDRAFLGGGHCASANTYRFLVSAFMLGFTVFLMRGALQPVFLRIMGFFLFLIFTYVCQRLVSRSMTSARPREALRGEAHER